jgi:DNA invertase Pin-like site-specific DNA recombinase
MLIGYARVSTEGQNLSLQTDALTRVGCEQIFTDVAGGAKAERHGLAQSISHLRQGDTLVVWKLDRLGRSLRHLIDAVNGLQAKGVGFRSLQENIDTVSPGGKLFFHVCGALAEFERDLVRERTMAGLESARRRGRLGGRPAAMDEKKKRQARALLSDHTTSIAEVCATLGISRATLYRHLPAGSLRQCDA